MPPGGVTYNIKVCVLAKRLLPQSNITVQTGLLLTPGPRPLKACNFMPSRHLRSTTTPARFATTLALTMQYHISVST